MNATELRAKWPAVFGGRCEISIGDGWCTLVDSLLSHLESIKFYNGDSLGSYLDGLVAQQVKEKFGRLRFYYEHASAESRADGYTRGAVGFAEYLSTHTCEICGQHGELRYGGWIKALCDKHANRGATTKEDEQP